MAEALPDLTHFQTNLLVAIRDSQAPHGLGIKEFLEEYYTEEIHHGRLYPNLDTLVQKGLVKKGEIDQRTNRYELTQRGQNALNEYAEFVGDEDDE